MSDIKKFTGYLSSDGKSHTSQKGAVAHELELKTVAAVNAAFPDGLVRTPDGTQDSGALETPLADYILANRVAILAALNQEVLLRKKRTAKKPATNAANDAGQAAA